MSAAPRSEKLIPAGLLALSFVPVIAGAFRVIQLAQGAPITPENARLFAAPAVVVLHIVSSTAFCFTGAFQFTAGFRRRHPSWHRVAGAVFLLCGVVSAASALWMTQMFPFGSAQGLSPAAYDGPCLYAVRLAAGSALILFLTLSGLALMQRDFQRHGAWMMRAYAVGLGAGTQVLTHLPWFVFPSIRGELTRTICMAAGWAINLGVAEWIITRQLRHRASPALSSAARHAVPVD